MVVLVFNNGSTSLRFSIVQTIMLFLLMVVPKKLVQFLLILNMKIIEDIHKKEP